MQTFLPYKDFCKCAEVLDNRRLFKQLIESRQILAALGVPVYKNDGTLYRKTHTNHPCVDLWREQKKNLCLYHDYIVSECIHRKINIKCGYLNAKDYATMWTPPSWLTDDLCSMYRSLLLRKDPAHYGQFGWTDDPERPFVWPNGKVSKS